MRFKVGILAFLKNLEKMKWDGRDTNIIATVENKAGKNLQRFGPINLEEGQNPSLLYISVAQSIEATNQEIESLRLGRASGKAEDQGEGN